MSQKDTIEKAYGSIPKEVGYNIEFFEIPTIRGVKYYFHKLVRFFTR
jgi:hypothetical protein